MRKILFPVALAALVVPTFASAVTFEEVDTDANGMITMSEAMVVMPGASAEDIATFDADGDGMLSPEEFAAIPQQ